MDGPGQLLHFHHLLHGFLWQVGLEHLPRDMISSRRVTSGTSVLRKVAHKVRKSLGHCSGCCTCCMSLVRLLRHGDIVQGQYSLLSLGRRAPLPITAIISK